MLKLIFQNGERVPPRPAKPSQDELVLLAEAAARRDERAIRTLIHIVGPHLLRTVRAVLGRAHPAIDDVAQEAVVEFLSALDRFRGEATVVHYACRVAVMCALHQRRREAAQRRALSPEYGERVVEDADTCAHDTTEPEELVDAQRSSAVVLELLSTLPENQAEAFALHVVLGHTVSEIAETLGAPTETVRSRLRLARQALRRKVQAHPLLREVAEER
ncbi:MAG: RNA polymerase sigma factor [Polyangiaceae bacterium]